KAHALHIKSSHARIRPSLSQGRTDPPRRISPATTAPSAAHYHRHYNRIRIGSAVRPSSLADAKASEDLVEHAVSHLDTTELGERVRTLAQLDRDHFRRPLRVPRLVRGGEGVAGGHRATVLAGGRHERRLGTFAIRDAGDVEDSSAQGREAIS